MVTPLDIERELLDYFAAIGAAPGHAFSLRDFHSQVMMNAFTPEERDGLPVALASLVAAGLLTQSSPTEYLLTDEGLRRIAALRAQKRDHRLAPRPGAARVKAKCD